MKKHQNKCPNYSRIWFAINALLVLLFLMPIVFLFVSAFKGDELQLLKDMGSLAAFVPQGDLSWQNFRDVFARTSFGLALFNSLLTVNVTVALGMLVNSMLGYALACFKFRGRQTLLAVVIALIIIPFEAIAVLLLLLVSELPWWLPGVGFEGLQRGWLDSYQVQVLPFIAHAFSVYLFYQFFVSLPKDLEEAALMDGAGRWRIYWSIVLPLCKPVIATVAVLQFLSRWGDLLRPVMAVRGEEFATPPSAMRTFFGQFPRQ